MLAGLVARAKARGLPYLIVGGVNTALGYGVTVGLYYLLRPYWPLVPVALLANVICITFSFVTYKIFIFKSSGRWLPEYLRSYVVYGGSALFGIAGLWFLAEVLGMTVWLAQGLVMAAGVFMSFVGHELFTFRMGAPCCGRLDARGFPPAQRRYS
jgi:putative flippase GtrA